MSQQDSNDTPCEFSRRKLLAGVASVGALAIGAAAPAGNALHDRALGPIERRRLRHLLHCRSRKRGPTTKLFPISLHAFTSYFTLGLNNLHRFPRSPLLSSNREPS